MIYCRLTANVDCLLQMMRKMGGLGGGDEKFDLNDLEGSEEEDDDDLPDLEN